MALAGGDFLGVNQYKRDTARIAGMTEPFRVVRVEPCFAQPRHWRDKKFGIDICVK